MVNHYSVSKKRRTTDAFTPGGVMGKRPDYATIVYCNLIRQTYKHKPIIIGGIEASLRRLAHYDYWSNKLKRSILLDSGADLISYGMGEHSIVEIADALDSGLDIKDITFIDGTVYKTRDRESIYDAIELPQVVLPWVPATATVLPYRREIRPSSLARSSRGIPFSRAATNSGFWALTAAV